MTSAGVVVGAIATLGTVPVFGGMLVAASRRRRPRTTWLGSTALALGGGVTLPLGGPSSGNRFALGVGEGVAAGLAYTIFTESCRRQVRRGGAPATVMAVTLGLAGILLSPVLALTSLTWLGTVTGLVVATYLAVVTTAGTYLAYGWGLRTTPLDTVVTLLLAEPATAAVLGIAVLHEPRTRWTWSGLALIGIALVTLTRTGSGSASTEDVSPITVDVCRAGHHRGRPSGPAPRPSGYRSDRAGTAGTSELRRAGLDERFQGVLSGRRRSGSV
jgi:DME family drug/metabolite transporter